MNNFLTIPEVEIEVRLGSFNNKKFDSSIDKDYFNKLILLLDSYSVWNSVIVLNTVEYILDSNRTIVTENNKKTNIIKKNILKRDIILNNFPFDIRFAINQELRSKTEVTPDPLNGLIRQKSRKSYYSSNFKYELTYVIETRNNIPKEKYEVEIELIINEETLEWNAQYLNDFLVCKIQDIFDLLEQNCKLDNLQII